MTVKYTRVPSAAENETVASETSDSAEFDAENVDKIIDIFAEQIEKDENDLSLRSEFLSNRKTLLLSCACAFFFILSIFAGFHMGKSVSSQYVAAETDDDDARNEFFGTGTNVQGTGKDYEISSNTNSKTACNGAKVYLIRLPEIFNFKECDILFEEGEKSNDVCPQVHAFRRERLDLDELPRSMIDFQEVLYDTQQFDVNSIINYRIENSECRVFNRAEADIFYVEIFLGPLAAVAWRHPNVLTENRAQWEMLFDYVHHVMRTGKHPLPEAMNDLEHIDNIKKDLEAISQLPNSSQWNRCHGCDHFMVSGRIAMDFQRMGGIVGGRKAQGLLPHEKWENVNFFSIEGNTPENYRFPFFVGIPYPGHVHPSSTSSLNHLIDLITKRKRKYMISLIGKALHKRIIDIKQCGHLPESTCVFMPCTRKTDSVCIEHGAVKALELMADSVFCYEPHGDSPTRQGLFDAISVGCIPIVPDEKSFGTYKFHTHDFGKFTLIAKNINEAVEKIEELGVEGYKRMFKNLLEVLPNVLWAHQDTGFDDALRVMLKGLSCKAATKRNVQLPSYC